MITIISGTNRIGSYSRKLSELICDALKSKGEEAVLLSIEDLPKDFPFTKINDLAHPEFDQLVQDRIANVNKFIFVVAEYNGGFPGMLKTFIDSVHPKYFKNKKAGIAGLSSGQSGALRALDHLTGVLHYLQVEVLSEKPRFADIEQLMANDSISDAKSLERMNRFLDKFIAF